MEVGCDEQQLLGEFELAIKIELAWLQGASSRFAGFSSKAKQAPVEEATAEQPAPEEALLSPSKRAKTGAFGQQVHFEPV